MMKYINGVKYSSFYKIEEIKEQLNFNLNMFMENKEKKYPCLFINMSSEDIKEAAKITSEFRENYYKNNTTLNEDDFFEEI